MAKKPKYYVVWKGHHPGVYLSWKEAEKQIKGYSGAEFKSYPSMGEAEMAFKNPEKFNVPTTKTKKPRYYVIWKGHKAGIYDNWIDAAKQIHGFKKPVYQAFGSKQMAEKAYADIPENYLGRGFKKTRDMTTEEKIKYGEPNMLSISVDAACNNKGDCEYQGVVTDTGTQLFHLGPLKDGTNNIGEFLALVHALAYLKKNRSDLPIYSDSKIAMNWIIRKKANTSSKNADTQHLITRGEQWLRANEYPNKIIKWQTKFWGEIPADFGRK